MIYIATFLSSALFGYWATRINPKTNRGLVFLCSLVSILIPSVLAGLRDVTIGTDVQVYLLDEYEKVQILGNIGEFLSYFSYIERGFSLLVFYTTKVFGDIQWVMFLIELIIMTCMYIGAWYFRKQVSLPIVLIVFFFLFYNETFNMMRQSIALAIVFMALQWLFKKKYVKYFIAVIVAMQFHSSAVIALLLLFAFVFLECERFKQNSNAKTMRGYLFILFLIIGMVIFPTIAKWLVNIGIFDFRYLNYIADEFVFNPTGYMFVCLVEIILMFVFVKDFESLVEYFDFHKINLFITLITLQLVSMVTQGQRVSLYFAYTNILLMAMLPRAPKKQINKALCSIIVMALLFSYWLFYYVIRGNAATYPYIPYWV